MSAVLPHLLSTLEPPLESEALQDESEEGVRFVHGEKFVIRLMDDSAAGDIQLIALTCADAEDESLGYEQLDPEQWEVVDDVEDDEFSHFVMLHGAVNVLSMMSAEPRAALDSVRFNAWLHSFVQATSRKLRFANEFRLDALGTDQPLTTDSQIFFSNSLPIEGRF